MNGDRTITQWGFHQATWVWVNTYRYIFSGMNIHLPAILGFTRYQGFDPSPHLDHWKFAPHSRFEFPVCHVIVLPRSYRGGDLQRRGDQMVKLTANQTPWMAQHSYIFTIYTPRRLYIYIYIYIWATVKTPAILNMYSTDIGLWKLMEIVKNTR